MENRKKSVTPFEEVKDQIKEEALKETAQEVVKELREKASVEFPAEVTAPTEAPAADAPQHLLKHQRQTHLLQKPNNHPLGEPHVFIHYWIVARLLRWDQHHNRNLWTALSRQSMRRLLLLYPVRWQLGTVEHLAMTREPSC